MLDKKTIYAIYLLHKVNDLGLEVPSSKKVRKNSPRVINVLRLKSYLHCNGQIMRNLDDTSLLILLEEMNNVLKYLPLTPTERAFFPRTLHQFNSSFELWLERIKANQLR